MRLEQALSMGAGRYPPLDEQWVEDRFWVCVHYCSEKIARGEYFEALEMLGFLRMQVLGPLAMRRQGYEARGLRKIETLLPEFTDKLKATVVQPERSDLQNATELVAALYLELQKT
ncbi:hypothetical protein E1162_06080 [Rhodobacteraceae bacterium RKSG542]|uniref:hypothetical protein n=1 Tax=Pseudovibrio flavus TaxID=2529854 RepID=UPI0012BC7B13|nr:hypothetical protein [Pseudovibrio flavus]MTI16802.1 hypothetical protein [Pseudovibrio flavus]